MGMHVYCCHAWRANIAPEYVGGRSQAWWEWIVSDGLGHMQNCMARQINVGTVSPTHCDQQHMCKHDKSLAATQTN